MPKLKPVHIAPEVPLQPYQQPSPSFPNSRRSLEAQAEVERIGKVETYLLLERDDELGDWLDDLRDLKICGCAIASHDSGLPKACQLYRMQYVKRRGNLFEIPAPVIYIEMDEPATPTGLYRTILGEMGHPLASSSHLRDLRSRSWATLTGYGVKLLIVGNSDCLKLETFEELINLFGKLRITVVLAGSDRLKEVISRKNWRYLRVHNSFLEFHEYHNLNLLDVAEVVDDWEEKLLKPEERWHLSSIPGAIEIIQARSEGLIEKVYELLRKIAVWKIDDPSLELNPSNILKRLSYRNQPLIKL